jgi:hypothetical protein
VRDFLDYLAECGAGGRPGLAEGAIDGLARALRADLPDQVRELFRRCGGIDEDALDHMPMRLYEPDEAIRYDTILRDAADMYWTDPQQRYLFSDDGSNWAGVFVAGPLTGKVTILDHDAPSRVPRFRDVYSFLTHLVTAGRAGLDFTEMSTDYPLTPASPAAVVAEAAPLSAWYLDRFRSSGDIPAGRLDDSAWQVLSDAQIGLILAAPTRWHLLREFLQHPNPFLRWTTLKVAQGHRSVHLVPDVVAYAKGAQARGDYGHWNQALKTLAAMRATAEFDLLRRDAPPNWPVPRMAD